MGDGQRVSWFNERNTEGSLVLNPKYQRKPVWSIRNKQYLIDTILRDLPIPEIYMQVKTESVGNSKAKTEYIIIDGQQRIRAILEFIAGEFEVAEEDNPEHAGKYFQDLPTGIQTNFWAYKLQVREIDTNSDEHIRAIFQRMNKNVVPLNQQELRNATYIGHFITLMNQLAEEQEFFSENGIFTAYDIKRMKDAEFISELFIAMMQGIQNKNDTLDHFYHFYDASFPNKEEKKKEFDRIISLISDIFGLLKGTRYKVKSDFYCLFYCLYQLNKEYYVSADKYECIKKELFDFSDQVTKDGEDSKDIKVKEYCRSIQAHTNDKSSRETRYNALRKLIIPYLVPRDKRRHFTEEERLIAWALDKKKICAICGESVKWDDYNLDHKKPHNKGGLTCLENSQITHKSCNSSKGDKVDIMDRLE